MTGHPKSHKVVVYKAGLVACSVCAPADMPIPLMAERVNAQYPTGISTPWTLSPEPFNTGEPNPSPCNETPGRVHYLLSC